MFYSYELLIQRNKNFAIIWRVVHQPKKPFTRKEIAPINLEQACQELRQYIPTGVLSASELKKKFSLYLLSQLMLGIVLVHSKKLSYLIKDFEEALKGLRPETLTIKPEKTTETRKRKAKTVEELIGEEVGAMLTPKKRRSGVKRSETPIPTARREDITLREEAGETRDQFDATNAMAVFGQEDLAPMTAEDREMLDREISAARLRPVDFSVLETPAVPPQRPFREVRDEIQFTPQKSMDEERSRRESLGMDRQTMEAGRRPDTLNEFDFEPPPKAPTPIPQGDLFEAQPQSSLEPDSGILLESLPVVMHPPTKRRAHRKLMVDHDTYISNERMGDQIRNYSDTLKSKEEIPAKIEKEVFKPVDFKSLNILQVPRRAIHKDLLEIIDTAARNIPFKRITFQEAQNKPMSERFLRPNAIRWVSEEEEQAAQSPERAEGEQPKFSMADLDFVAPKFSIADIFESPEHPPRPSSAALTRPSSVLESHRRQTDARSLDELILPPDVQLLDELEKRRTDSIGMPLQPQLPPPFEFDFTEPIPPPERMRSPMPPALPMITVPFEPEELLQKIADCGTETVKFSEIVNASDKNKAAKSFYNLLVLLKKRNVKVKQETTYGEIFIKMIEDE